MISISLEHLRDFQKRTQYIGPHPSLPALSYVKMETMEGKTYLTKNNLQALCVSKYPSAGLRDHEPILIDNKIFDTAVNFAEFDTITFSWDDARVYITDGATPIYFARENEADFPKTPDYKNTAAVFKLGRGHLDCIQIAKQYMLNNPAAGNYRFVHIVDEFILGIHTNYFYVNNRFSGLPSMSITGEMADVLCANAQVMEFNFGSTDNHYFFQTENVVYIFTRLEARAPNIRSAIWEKIMTPGGKEFTVPKTDFVRFMNKANSTSGSELVRCTMDGDAEGLHFTMNDASKNRGVNKKVKLEGELDSFLFDSKLICDPVKAIPYENLKCKVNRDLLISAADGREHFVFIGMAS